ncbi:glycerol-3-phosphate 1-O-acyltransferase PlsY [candidate division KSB1 bacterium]
MLSLLLILLLGYFIGSIPFGIIVSRILRGIDIREHGSGNAGATNVMRVIGWKAGVTVLMLDAAKGFVAVYFISRIGAGNIPFDFSLVQILAGIAAVCGHIWTVFAKFRGGKGVATAAGMFIGLAPGAVLISLLVFVVVFLIFRYVSLGSLLAALTLSAVFIVRKFWLQHDIPLPLLCFTFITTALIIITHRSNIKRLLNGTENKISFR